MKNFASLCILSFERLDFLQKSLDSLKRNTDFPYELIINDDGSNPELQKWLFEQQSKGEFSRLILNGGQNMGVGNSMHNCIGVSNGDYIFKLDTDLEYLPGWLSKVCNILENNKDIGACGMFDYRHYDPNDTRFTIKEEREDCYIVTDFVNSGYGFRREVFEQHGKAMGDDGWQGYLREQGLLSAITKEDVVNNFGFGKNSIYMLPTGGVRPKSPLPRIFNKG